MKGWVDEFVKLLRHALVYPPRARIARPSGTVVVEFTVEAIGKVKDCILASKSGSDTLDNYTMETICGLEMPPFPRISVSARSACGCRNILSSGNIE